MRNRPTGSNDESPVPSFESTGPTVRSSASWARAPNRMPAAPSPTRPRNTRRPTGVPVGAFSVATTERYVRAARALRRRSAEGRDLREPGPQRLDHDVGVRDGGSVGDDAD